MQSLWLNIVGNKVPGRTRLQFFRGLAPLLSLAILSSVSCTQPVGDLSAKNKHSTSGENAVPAPARKLNDPVHEADDRNASRGSDARSPLTQPSNTVAPNPSISTQRSDTAIPDTPIPPQPLPELKTTPDQNDPLLTSDQTLQQTPDQSRDQARDQSRGQSRDQTEPSARSATGQTNDAAAPKADQPTVVIRFPKPNSDDSGKAKTEDAAERPSASSPSQASSGTAQVERTPGAEQATSGSKGTTSQPRDGDTFRTASSPAPQARTAAVESVGAGPRDALTIASEAERNQKIAEGWPQPQLVFFITGQQHGYMEPCGCTGLENQKGGLNRRDTLLQEIVAKGWNVVPIDVGNQVRRTGIQPEWKFLKTVETLRLMRYEAVAFGVDDLKLPSLQLISGMVDADGNPKMFVSANVSVISSDYPGALFRIVKQGGRTVGITSVLGEDGRKELEKVLQNQEIQIQPAVESVRKAVAEMQKQNCDYYVLLSHASIDESTRIAREIDAFDLVVTSGGFGEPLFRPEEIEGTKKSLLVQVGVKGMYAGILGLFDDATNPIRYQRIALSSQFKDSDRAMEIFKRYQQDLAEAGLEGLKIRPLLHSSTGDFVGSETCGECHEKAYNIWKTTKHAQATESLIHPPNYRADIPRHFDPECLSCHVTGWNAQLFYPYKTGYISLEKTPKLVGNGCENCHGPGSAHVAAESGANQSDASFLEKLRQELRLSTAAARDKCMTCHDMDNSPEFHKDGGYEKYLEPIKHW